MSSSVRSSRSPCDETMSQTLRSASTSCSSRRTAYGAPDAPVIAMTMGSGASVIGQIRRSPRCISRSISTKKKNVMLIMPFIVKNAASSFASSPGFTSECS